MPSILTSAPSEADPGPPPAPAQRTTPGGTRRRAGALGMALGAVGVVFGDIGTSPLYSLQTVFSANHHAVAPTAEGVRGVISLVFWAITIVVSVKYVTFIMRADNRGEGGIMALTALIEQVARRGRLARGAVLVALGVFGASLFYGDGMITPSISVLSAVEGLKVAAPGLQHLVIPITLTVLTLLFALQRYGTHIVGRLFGPVMVIWFGVLALAGAHEVVAHPQILQALSPAFAVEFFLHHGAVAFIALGAVVLAVTGAEALYADMGHFGRAPIRRAWFFLVFPALTLDYLGQGSLILRAPQSVSNPFFLLVPGWAQLPMVVLATAATVIASQSVISGAFSVTRQAVQLGFLPRLTIRHTSEHEIGQVYAPAVNWALFIAVVGLILGFRTSANLASAYGVAVTGTFVLNTILFLAVARYLWREPRWRIALAGSVFLTVELAFFFANLTKVQHGGWLPLISGLAVFTVLQTWQRGRRIVTANRTAEEGPLRPFVDALHEAQPPVHRIPGTAIFLNPSAETTPLALRANVEHNHVLHETVLIVSVQWLTVPHVPDADRIAVDDLGYTDDGITHITARFGYQDDPVIPQALRLACAKHLECDVDLDQASYFLSRITIRRTAAPGMRQWRKKLFIAISRNTASPVEYFGLPANRTVIVGSHIDL
jgi:KUP system potassium uptake protein